MAVLEFFFRYIMTPILAVVFVVFVIPAMYIQLLTEIDNYQFYHRTGKYARKNKPESKDE